MCKVTYVIGRMFMIGKNLAADKLPLPKKGAKARAILAHTNAFTLNADEHVCNGIHLPRTLVC
jgi:hypothetical protein